MSWTALLIGCGACYALKVAGLSVPDRLLASPKVQSIANALPVALLAALIALQTWTSGKSLLIDARSGGLVVAAIAVVLRAPFIVVVALAAMTVGLIRLL